ncbi:MAG: Sigma-70, region 4 [Chloroflexota bacterium]|nr:Sigma-70, region 4 [Chloroflexota bacterium]
MGTRWFGTAQRQDHARRATAGDQHSDEPKAVLLHDAIAAWRAWLTSGARRVPIDNRRGRGAETQLKKTLMGGPSGLVDFSSAMARQAIDEAMNELPTQHRQVVKLAYFGGLTNRQIAQQLGLTVGGVRRRLQESLAIVSAYVERGRATGKRAVHGLSIWLSWRRFGDGPQILHGPAVDQVLQAGMVAVVTVAASAMLLAHPPPISAAPTPHQARAATFEAAPAHQLKVVHPNTSAVLPSTVMRVPANGSGPAAAPPSAAVKLPVAPLSVSLPAPPAIPPLPLSLPAPLPISLP